MSTIIRLFTLGIIAGAFAFGDEVIGGTIYDSGDVYVTNSLDESNYLAMEYQQFIEYTDTNSDGTSDTYRSNFSFVNNSKNGLNNPEDFAFYQIRISAELAGRGCTNLNNTVWNWIYQASGSNSCSLTTNMVGDTWVIFPGVPIGDYYFTYDINEEKILGWESVDAEMVANSGILPFTYQVPITCQMTTSNGATYGLLVGSGLTSTNSTHAQFESASQLNSDSDCQLDWEEYIAGTEETNSDSYFKSSISNGVVMWTWTSNRLYSVFTRTNLTGEFTVLTNGVSGNGFTDPMDRDEKFYRVEVSIP